MHDYSIDNHPKDKILFILAIAAVSIAPPLNSLIVSIGVKTGFYSSSATTISVFVVFSLIYWLFNKYLWRCSGLRKILLVPDINGNWSVDGLQTLKNGVKSDTNWHGTVTITQSWSKILIHLKTGQSNSKSVSASVHKVDGVGYKVLYQYENAPSADQNELAKHSGTVELLLNLDCDLAEGSYYTDQHRNTIGTMKLRKITNVD